MTRTFPFLEFSPAPAAAPDNLVARVATAAEAAQVSLRASRLKQAYVAASLGISPAYLSLILKGARQIPEWFVAPFCSLTGSRLLAQRLELDLALTALRKKSTTNDRVAELAEFLRSIV